MHALTNKEQNTIDKKKIKYTYLDLLSAWVAGKKNEKEHGGKNDLAERPDFVSWFNENFKEGTIK